MRGLRLERASLIQAMNGPVDPERTMRSKLIGDSFRCSQLVPELSKQILPPPDVILALDPPPPTKVSWISSTDLMKPSEGEIRRVRLVDPDSSCMAISLRPRWTIVAVFQ
jgi:hypothetical protein